VIASYALLVLSIAFTLVYDSSICYNSLLADCEAYYEAGDYDLVIGVSIEDGSYVRNAFFYSSKGEEVEAYAHKAFNAKAQEFVDKKDYKGFYEWCHNMTFDDVYDEWLYNDLFGELDVTIPEEDYPLVKDMLYQVAIEKWDLNLDAYGYSQGYFNKTFGLQYLFADLVDDGTDDSLRIYAVVRNQFFNGFSLKDILSEYFDYEIAQDILLSDDNISGFMIGRWVSTDNSKDYIEFYTNDNGGVSVQYNIPWPDVECDYYEIKDCNMIFTKEAGDEDEKVADVYKFTFINADKMECYCYENGKTYTMTRR
jgi:hypothetical protein